MRFPTCATGAASQPAPSRACSACCRSCARKRRRIISLAYSTQKVDYLTLIGDSVDNVDGVEKVGSKTAVKWLSQYGTLDEVVAHDGEITGAVGENLRKALQWLPTAKKLLSIKCDVPLPVGID